VTDPGHCRYCGRFVPEADPEAERVVCSRCAMGRAAAPEVEKECRRQEIEWLQRQRGSKAVRLAKRKARELRAMEEVEA
jgi:recombinational DNA repair protein (RecF pathway)